MHASEVHAEPVLPNVERSEVPVPDFRWALACLLLGAVGCHPPQRSKPTAVGEAQCPFDPQIVVHLRLQEPCPKHGAEGQARVTSVATSMLSFATSRPYELQEAQRMPADKWVVTFWPKGKRAGIGEDIDVFVAPAGQGACAYDLLFEI